MAYLLFYIWKTNNNISNCDLIRSFGASLFILLWTDWCILGDISIKIPRIPQTDLADLPFFSWFSSNFTEVNRPSVFISQSRIPWNIVYQTLILFSLPSLIDTLTFFSMPWFFIWISLQPFNWKRVCRFSLQIRVTIITTWWVKGSLGVISIANMITSFAVNKWTLCSCLSFLIFHFCVRLDAQKEFQAKEDRLLIFFPLWTIYIKESRDVTKIPQYLCFFMKMYLSFLKSQFEGT